MENKIYLNDLVIYCSKRDNGTTSVSIMSPCWNKETKTYDTLRVYARKLRVIEDKELAYEY